MLTLVVIPLFQGFYWRRKSCYSIAARAAEKAMQKMYIGRKMKKREFRSVTWARGRGREEGCVCVCVCDKA